MAFNYHPEYNPNMKIKSETSGTEESSASTSTINTAALSAAIANIKSEPGEPNSGRLKSLFRDRNWTLQVPNTLSKKKTPAPNINVKRLKDRIDQSIVQKNETESTSDKERSRGKGQIEKKYKDGQFKGRGKMKEQNFVQMKGIFSQELASNLDSSGSKRSTRSYRESSGKEKESVQKSIKSRIRNIIDSDDEDNDEAKIKKLLKNDYTADEDDCYAPLSLPMTRQEKYPLNSYKTDQIKCDDDESVNSVKLSNGKVKEAIIPQQESFTVEQVLEKNQKNNFILLQLPDCLPGFCETDETSDDSKTKKNTEPNNKKETVSINKFCTLTDLREGTLGKLQILKSGKARMVLGNNKFIVELGSSVNFRQDLVAAKLNGEQNEIINLGQVNDTLICSPDWEDLLKDL